MTGVSFQAPRIPPEVESLLLWRDPKKSGAVLAAVLVSWFFLGSGLSPWTPLQLLFAAIATACPAFVAWNSAAPLLKRQGPPVPAVLREGLTQQQVDEFAERSSKVVNQALAVIGTLVSGQDPKLSGVVTAAAFAAFKIFGAISLLNLVLIAVLLAFSLPKVYELKKQDIDEVIRVVVSKSKELYAEVDKVVFKKVPKAPVKVE